MAIANADLQAILLQGDDSTDSVQQAAQKAIQAVGNANVDDMAQDILNLLADASSYSSIAALTGDANVIELADLEALAARAGNNTELDVDDLVDLLGADWEDEIPSQNDLFAIAAGQSIDNDPTLATPNPTFDSGALFDVDTARDIIGDPLLRVNGPDDAQRLKVLAAQQGDVGLAYLLSMLANPGMFERLQLLDGQAGFDFNDFAAIDELDGTNDGVITWDNAFQLETSVFWGLPIGNIPGFASPPRSFPPVGQPPVVQPPVGQPPVGQPPVGQPPVVQPPVGQPPVGQPPVVQPPVGQPPVGQPTFGNPYIVNYFYGPVTMGDFAFGIGQMPNQSSNLQTPGQGIAPQPGVPGGNFLNPPSNTGMPNFSFMSGNTLTAQGDININLLPIGMQGLMNQQQALGNGTFHRGNLGQSSNFGSTSGFQGNMVQPGLTFIGTQNNTFQSNQPQSMGTFNRNRFSSNSTSFNSGQSQPSFHRTYPLNNSNTFQNQQSSGFQTWPHQQQGTFTTW